MDKAILGISAFYHDSAATLVRNGQIVAAAQEERFTRIKHDESFPAKAVGYCLEKGGVAAEDLGFVAFYEKPLLKFDRLLDTYLAFAPLGLRSFLKAMPVWLKTKLWHNREILRGLENRYKKPIIYIEHHMSHAASAFFPSPFEEAAILTLDGVGEWDTASIAVGEGNRIRQIKTLHFPHSLGLLYSAFTYFTGFRVNSGEYKLMGLAPYGRPKYVDLILDQLIDLKKDGSFALNMEYFTFAWGLRMTGKRFETLFGMKRRKPEDPITQQCMDLAASIQAVTEMVVIRIARYAREVTGEANLCLAGGVALNCVANGKLQESGVFDNIWIQPASGDAGGALGAALFVQYQLLDRDRVVDNGDAMSGSYLGPGFNGNEIEPALNDEKIEYSGIDDEGLLLRRVAELIERGNIVGWFQGRMEFGPRALGGRSIIGDPRSPEMQARMNLRIKFRESFRPFAPSVLEEDVSDYFARADPSPYMLQVSPVRESIRKNLNEAEEALMLDADLRKRVKVCRSELPAITHVDMSARIQTVSEERNGRYYRLIREFKRLTGCGVLVNTSFNVRGEPIVHTPGDAIRCFLATDMDVLVVENFLLLKTEQPADALNKYQSHVESFELD